MQIGLALGWLARQVFLKGLVNSVGKYCAQQVSQDLSVALTFAGTHPSQDEKKRLEQVRAGLSVHRALACDAPAHSTYVQGVCIALLQRQVMVAS